MEEVEVDLVGMEEDVQEEEEAEVKEEVGLAVPRSEYSCIRTCIYREKKRAERTIFRLCSRRRFQTCGAERNAISSTTQRSTLIPMEAARSTIELVS